MPEGKASIRQLLSILSICGHHSDALCLTLQKTSTDYISKKRPVSDFGKHSYFGNLYLICCVLSFMKSVVVEELSRRRRPWDDAELNAHIRTEGLRLPPAELRLIDREVRTELYGRIGDGILEADYQGHTARYIVEAKPRSTPQALNNAVAQALLHTSVTGLSPMIIAPYLSGDALTLLEEKGVSGVDLSGNGILLAPDFAVWRSGQPNRYPEVQPVRNLYRGVSAIFVRCLLLRPHFNSLKELREYALSRIDPEGVPFDGRAKLTMGTASKVIQQLEENLLVRRDESGLRVIDATRLMDGLKNQYRSPEGARLAGKTRFSAEEIWRLLDQRQTSLKTTSGPSRYAATGLGSAARYRVLSGPDKLSLYVSDLDSAANLVELRTSRVFPNVELIEDRSDAAYFDIRREETQVWASPIQTWLELATGGPREKEAAEALAPALAESRGEQFQ